MTEIWKDIEGYEGLYQVSNSGKVKALFKIVQRTRKQVQTYPEKILKPNTCHKGYCRVSLHNTKKAKTHSVHRLVALAFIPNPEGKPQVNHINGIKSDNSISNLEWVTNAENQKHAYLNPKRKRTTGLVTPISKRTININTGESYESIARAARANGLKPAQLYKILAGKRAEHFYIKQVA
jgi:hypothetical protein